MKKHLTSALVALSTTSLLIYSCGPKKIDPSSYPITPEDKKTVEVPEACKAYYESLKVIPKVAVVDFTNNTTFDAAKVVQAQGARTHQGSSAAALGIGATPTGVGVAYAGAHKSKTNVNMEAVSREVNAKLGKSIASAVSAYIANMGGAKVFTRQELQKVLNEQKFQQSGLTDEKTLVEVGKLAGVRYIITGSVDNVTLKWIEAGKLKEGLQQHLGLAGTLLAAGVETQEGWNVITDLTIKVIDVKTGEVVLAKTVSGREVLGKTPTLTYDTIIGGIKKAAMDALDDAKTDLSKYFSIKGYIVQLRTSPDKKERYALINMGSKNGVKPGDEFFVYAFEEVVDPLTNKVSCNLMKLPVTLEASDQVSATQTWTVTNGDEKQIMRLRLGQIVERAPLKKKVLGLSF